LTSAIVEFAATFLFVLGCISIFSAALGVARFPDILMRIQSSTKATSGGAITILSGLMLLNGFSMVSLRLLVLLVLILALTPTVSHAIARSAHIQGTLPPTAFEIYPPKKYEYPENPWREQP